MSSEPRIFKSPHDRDPSLLPEMSIVDYLLKRLKENGLDKTDTIWVANASTGVNVYFKDIEKDSIKVASALTRLGFKNKDVLYFVTYETAVLYIIQLGVWRLNGAVRGGFQKETPEEYARQMKDSKARYVLVDKETYPLVQKSVEIMPWPVKIISFDDVGKPEVATVKSLLEDDGSAMPEHVEINPKEDIVCIPNTSASTGLPKGVCHTHFTLMMQSYDPKSVDIFMWPFMTPMSNYAAGSFMASCSSITNGSSVYHLGKFEKETYFEQLAKYKPGNCLMYPFLANWFIRSEELEKYDLSFLHMVTIAGSVLDPATADLIHTKLPNVRIAQFYGMTECFLISGTEVDTTPDTPRNRRNPTKENQGEISVSSGKLSPYVQAKIVDVSSGNLLGPNERGLIYVRAPTLMKGYLREGHEKPVLPEDEVEDGWLRTGDIGFFDEHSNIYVLERTSFLFKYYMFFVSPTEIENTVKLHEDVLEVGVVDIPDPKCTSVARAFVRRKANATCTEEELVQFVAQRLPEHKQLHGGVQFVDKLPESKGNKLDRIALKKLALAKK
ncbi:luciferin 4-monooxygenase-like isoform X1 [Neocloeon triangulifer]|uniref:luciferin 4-monooxygenase-like isoform X1 n=1 Tax=Neocloeon triangulifer TaxID=2078957 RepID=UPI00286F2696|nr:luciferin 4-monooxygenase-like isoform X1 [Neocloeon triangulifer]XP_059485962.1 luciferin 4-monooxygenase-like isoform X2 [Neocloeon triangulifer]XP_059485963.1 luciferin 4-monooxygenase-like isoform X1 [Neocloeon triangulifer]